MTHFEQPSTRQSDTPGPDTDDPREPPPSEDAGQPDPSGEGTSGDLGAPDIVGPFGEEMPVQHHDDIDPPGPTRR